MTDDRDSRAAHLVVADLSEAAAARLVDHFRDVCHRRGLALAAAVVDRAGHVVATTRRDGAQFAAMSLAVDKAWTAAAFGAPTSRWARVSIPGGSDWGLAGSVGGRTSVLPGGVPLFSDGALVGGLGISGAAGVVDEECAAEVAALAGLAGTRESS